MHDAVCELKPILDMMIQYEYPAHKMFEKLDHFHLADLEEIWVRTRPPSPA